MRIAVRVARILLGILFVFFGSNAFLNFLPMPPMPPGNARDFLFSLVQSHYVIVVGGCQVLGGALLIINRCVPLALTILGAVIVNILSYHIFMMPTGLPLALVAALLWAFLFYSHRQNFTGLFVQNTQPTTPNHSGVRT
jgi:putative oxidoreductase